MREIITQWVYTAFGALLVGPIAGLIAHSIRGVDGAAEATGLVAESPFTGMIRMILALCLCGGTMLIGAKLGFIRRAFFVGGLAMAFVAFSSGTVTGVIRASGGGAVFPRLVVESIILGAIFAAFVCVAGLIRKRADESFVMPSRRDARAILANVVAGVALAWAVARDGSGGQVLFAAFVAGLLGTLIARVVEPNASPLSPALSAAIMCVVAPGLWLIFGSGSSLATMYAGDIAGYALLTPVTWLSGVSMGIWGGSSWADSVVQKHTEAPAGSTPSRTVARG
jgi:hypothetical protein